MLGVLFRSSPSQLLRKGFPLVSHWSCTEPSTHLLARLALGICLPQPSQPVSYRCVPQCLVFMQVLGSQIWPSIMCSRHFTERAIFLAPVIYCRKISNQMKIINWKKESNEKRREEWRKVRRDKEEEEKENYKNYPSPQNSNITSKFFCS